MCLSHYEMIVDDVSGKTKRQNSRIGMGLGGCGKYIVVYCVRGEILHVYVLWKFVEG